MVRKGVVLRADRAVAAARPALSAVMVSYAEFYQRKARRTAAMKQGLRKYLGVPKDVAVYLDNGAFYFG